MISLILAQSEGNKTEKQIRVKDSDPVYTEGRREKSFLILMGFDEVKAYVTSDYSFQDWEPLMGEQ